MRALALIAPLLLLTTLSGCVRRVVTVAADEAGQPREEAPPGMVDVHFVSDDEGLNWNVAADGEFLCTTPCTKRIRTGSTVFFRGQHEGVFAPRLIDVAPGASRAVMAAAGSHHGLFVNGVTWTSLGGMGAIVAITLTAIGCSDLEKHGGMCTAGLITGGVSVPLTAAGILMLVGSFPEVHVLPVMRAEVAKGQPPVALAVTPVGLVGTF